MAASKRIHQMTIGQWETAFPTDEKCAEYLIRHRWPVGVRCPRCGSDKVSEMTTMPFKWQCYGCAPDSGYRFSHLVGTVFENTNKSLREWFRVIHMMVTSKKGVSALQVHRVMGFGSYRTAWYMCHRIRAAMQDKGFCQLMGIVEVDETYIGGKAVNKHGPRNRHHHRMSETMTPVIGAVQRKGNIVARVIAHADKVTLQGFVREVVSHKVSLLATDDHRAYKSLFDYPARGRQPLGWKLRGRRYPHEHD